MNIDLKIRYSTEKYNWLCFKHAVVESIKGKKVSTDIDEYDSEYYMGKTWCQHPECHP